jgi:hypothetical protein
MGELNKKSGGRDVKNTGGTMSSNIEKLERLARLRDSGALTITEFELEKRKLLAPSSLASERSRVLPAVAAIAALLAGGAGVWYAIGQADHVPPQATRTTPPVVTPKPIAAGPKVEPAPPPPPANPWVGKYKGTFEGDVAGSLTIREARNGRLRYSLAVGGPRCTGGLDGTFSQPENQTATVTAIDGEIGAACTLKLALSGRSIAVTEQEGCMDFHGFECSFSGTASR